MPIAPEYLHLVYEGPFPALLYGRNSRDPKKKGRSVGDQLSEGRTLCNGFNWPIVDEFKDTGISASRHTKKRRDEFEELIEAIEARKGRIVVAWEASRYYRDLEIYVRLRNACYGADVLLCYNGMVYDLSKSEDRKATAQDAIQAESEAEAIRDRNLRTVRLNAEGGKPHGKIPFGYMRRYDPDSGDLIGQFPHPSHASYVYDSFHRVDSGHSRWSVLQWLKSEPAAERPDGAPWNQRLVRSMLLNPAYVGKRLYRGKVLRKATWDPILTKQGADGLAKRGADGELEPDLELFRRVTKKLDDAAEDHTRDSRVAHLLSSIALCGECGDGALLSAGKQSGKRYYVCKTGLDTGLPEVTFDAYVEQAVLAWLMTDAARVALTPDHDAMEEAASAAQARIGLLTQQLEEARDLATTFDAQGVPGLSMLTLAAMEKRIQPQIDEAQTLIEASSGVSPLLRRLLDAKDPNEVWNGVPESDGQPERPGLTLEQRREAIRKIVTVRLHRARKRGVRKVEPGRIKLSFFGEPGYRARPLNAREFARQRAAGTGQGS